jgi:hypothetical protein
VIEVAVVLVEVDEQNGPRPRVRILRQRVEDVVDEVGATDRSRGARMFGVDRRRHQPHDLRQRAGGDVGAETGHQRLGFAAPHREVEQPLLGR